MTAVDLERCIHAVSGQILSLEAFLNTEAIRSLLMQFCDKDGIEGLDTRAFRSLVAKAPGLTSSRVKLYTVSPSQWSLAARVLPAAEAARVDPTRRDPFAYTQSLAWILNQTAEQVCVISQGERSPSQLVHPAHRTVAGGFSGASYIAGVFSLLVRLRGEPNVDEESCAIDHHECVRAGNTRISCVSFTRNGRSHRAYVGGISEPRGGVEATQRLLEEELLDNLKVSRVSEIYVPHRLSSGIHRNLADRFGCDAELGKTWACAPDSKSKFRMEGTSS